MPPDADWDDSDDPQDIDVEGDDEDEGEPVLVCPRCRKSVHEDTQQCPYCGDWITPVDASGANKRWIWAVAAVLLIVSMLLVVAL